MNGTSSVHSIGLSSDSFSVLERELMEAARVATVSRQSHLEQTRLRELIPDTRPHMPHAAGGLSEELQAAVTHITGRECVGPQLGSGRYAAPNPATARAMLKRWAMQQWNSSESR